MGSKGLKAHWGLTTVLAVVLTVASALATLSEKPKKLSAQEILEQYSRAVGGPDAMRQFISRAAGGKVTRRGEVAAPFYIAATPRALAVICQFQEFQFRQVYDGSESFFYPHFTGSESRFEDQFRKMLASGLMLNGIELYNALLNPRPDYALEASGNGKVSGRPTYVVDVKQNRRRLAQLHFDAETFFWLRTDFGTVRPLESIGGGTAGQEVPFYIETSDYRPVDGVMLPFRIKQSVPYPLAGGVERRTYGELTVTIDQYQHNVDLDPAFFAKPK